MGHVGDVWSATRKNTTQRKRPQGAEEEGRGWIRQGRSQPWCVERSRRTFGDLCVCPYLWSVAEQRLLEQINTHHHTCRKPSIFENTYNVDWVGGRNRCSGQRPRVVRIERVLPPFQIITLQAERILNKLPPSGGKLQKSSGCHTLFALNKTAALRAM